MFNSSLTSLPLIGRGKVRDLYRVDDQHLLIVTTDRLSAFDVVLPTPIRDKGKVLTALSKFWFAKLAHVIPNHLTGISPPTVVWPEERDQVEDRAMVVRRMTPLPIEAIVRGYLEGSGWQEYKECGTVCGIRLPSGLQRASRLPEPIFTPATKAKAGDHDENISYARMEDLIGAQLAAKIRDTALALYGEAAAHALTRGVIIADTKFEFGLDDAGKLFLIDEALTPDSSRFWPRDSYRPGVSPESFDKQFIRNWLQSIHFDKRPPAPDVPADIARATSEKYREALTRLTS